MIENKQRLLQPILSRFCDIYIPESFNPDTLDFYHFYHSQYYKTNELENHILNIQQKESFQQLLNHDNFDLFSYIDNLYELGFCSLDVLSMMEDENSFLSKRFSLKMTEKKKNELRFFYQKTKIDFRNEKLLMYYLLGEGINCYR